MYHSFLIHSSADGHLGCFHVLAIYKQCRDEHWGARVSFRSPSLLIQTEHSNSLSGSHSYSLSLSDWPPTALFSISPVCGLITGPPTSRQLYVLKGKGWDQRHLDYGLCVPLTDWNLGCYLNPWDLISLTFKMTIVKVLPS